ncbi:hypothetical protein [Nocardia beijingensis]
MDPEQFVYVDRDCEFFKAKIRDIQQMMTDIAQQQTWGLGENYRSKSGNELVSGTTMVKSTRRRPGGPATEPSCHPPVALPGVRD